MAVTTLKNTTWKFGEYLLSDYTTSFSYDISADISIHYENKVINTISPITTFDLHNYDGNTYQFPVNGNMDFDKGDGTHLPTNTLYSGYKTAPQILSSFRTNFEGVYITFLDGTDIDNANAIAWVQANATQVIDEPTEPTVCSITLNAIEPFEDYCENMQYSFADSVDWSNMSDLSFPATFNKFEIAFKNNDTEHSFGIFSNGTLMAILNNNDIYTYTAIGHDTLELRIMRTSITYNGVEVATFPKGKTATIKCENKKMTSDIVIVFGANGSITYKGIETAVQAGQTATLKCANKKMTENLYVTVEEKENIIEDELAGTWVLNDPLIHSSIKQTYEVKGTYHTINSDNQLIEVEFYSIMRDYYNSKSWLTIYAKDGYTTDNYVFNSYYVTGTSSGLTGDIRVQYGMGNNYKIPNTDDNFVALRTFTITSLLAEVPNGAELLAYLKTNATKVS